MIKVKMCGIRRDEDIEYVNMFMPEYIGYVFAKKSKRYITPERALELTGKLFDEFITPVGVFVDESVENIISIVRSGAIKIAQLHGNEDDAQIRAIQSEGIPVIKAFIVRSAEDVERANASPADYVLLDAGMGDGKTFDHELLAGIKRPYFLAGGLSPDNVRDAMKVTPTPYALDVSSGIEKDGVKDCELMRQFIIPFAEEAMMDELLEKYKDLKL